MRITKEYLENENHILQGKIHSLQKEIERQKNNSYLLMMETVRARRYAEAEHEACGVAKKECADALRKFSNIKKWMEYKGIYGYQDPQATDEMREDFKYEQRNL